MKPTRAIRMSNTAQVYARIIPRTSATIASIQSSFVKPVLATHFLAPRGSRSLLESPPSQFSLAHVLWPSARESPRRLPPHTLLQCVSHRASHLVVSPTSSASVFFLHRDSMLLHRVRTIVRQRNASAVAAAT